MWLHSKYSSLFMTGGSIQVVAVVVGARLSATSTRPPVRQNLFADLPRQLQHCACAWLPLQAELFTGMVEGNLRGTYKVRENAWLEDALCLYGLPRSSPLTPPYRPYHEYRQNIAQVGGTSPTVTWSTCLECPHRLLQNGALA